MNLFRSIFIIFYEFILNLYRISYLIVRGVDDFLSIKYVTFDSKRSKEEKRPLLKVFSDVSRIFLGRPVDT